MGKRKEKTFSREFLGNQLRDSYVRWNALKEEGGSDPFWPDGTNMNLVRNHILWTRKQCEEFLSEEDYPEEYYLDLPPEVDANYMANEAELRESARKSLKIYRSSAAYQYLLKNAGKAAPALQKEICLKPVLNYISGLETATNTNDLVTMRRHRNPFGYLESIERCAKKLKEGLAAKKTEPIQLSFFDLMEDED